MKFTPASVYMVVQQLAKAGFVAEHETLRTGMRPERTTYALTEAGPRAVPGTQRIQLPGLNHSAPWNKQVRGNPELVARALRTFFQVAAQPSPATAEAG